jgi:plastocyanin
MGYVAKLCAQYDTNFVNIAGDYLAAAVNEEVIKQAYLEAGRPDAFKPDTVRYVPGDQWAWTSASIGNVEARTSRERPCGSATSTPNP